MSGIYGIFETPPHRIPAPGRSLSGYITYASVSWHIPRLEPRKQHCSLAVNMLAATSFVALLCGAALADNCTESAASHSYWTIDELVLRVYNWDNQGTTGTFGFKSHYSGTNLTVECLAKDVDLAKLGDRWSTCNSPGTEFRLDFHDLTLSLKETWTCSG